MTPATIGAVAVLATAGLFLRPKGVEGISVLGAVMAVAGTALLTRFRSDPWWPAAVIVAGLVLVGHGDSANVVWFVLVLLVGCVEVRYGPTDGNVIWLGGMAVLAAAAWADPDAGWLAWVAGTTLATAGCRAGRHQAMLVHQVRAAQSRLTEQAAAEERNRIARELHDVIAHTLTVSLLHVTSARLAIEHDPADAVRALAEAERLGRESLDEVRRVVGLMREDSDGDTLAPLPTIADLDALVDRFSTAGLEVRVDVDSEVSTVPPSVGLSAYRILQEALTNAAKHGSGAPVAVSVKVGAGSLDLSIDSAGDPGAGQGLGVVGMRERVALLGGELDAGPGGRGWLVTASLPLRTAPPAATKAEPMQPSRAEPATAAEPTASAAPTAP